MPEAGIIEGVGKPIIMRPLVSILIPAHNAEKWIGDTIQSALVQTWPKKEIIIVDDGSSDNTLRIARKFESRLVKVVTQPNQGACNARNKARALSQGDFIQWLDADDILAPDKIMEQLQGEDMRPETRVLYSSSWGIFFVHPQAARFRYSPLWRDLSSLKWLQTSFGEGCWMAAHSWLVSRKLADLAGPWDEGLIANTDGEYFCRIVAASESVRFKAKSVCYYRKANPGSLSLSRSEKALGARILSLNACVDHLLALDKSESSKEACVNLLQSFVNDYGDEEPDNITAIHQRIVALGGSVLPPPHTAKTFGFSMIRMLLGLNAAKLLKRIVSRMRRAMYMKWEKIIVAMNNLLSSRTGDESST